MSAENPEIGDVWEALGSTSQATVTGWMNGSDAVHMMGSTGRQITMPVRSLKLTWKFVSGNQPHRCATPRCSQVAYLRIGNRDGWYCSEHVPRNQDVVLPRAELSEPQPSLTTRVVGPTCSVACKTGYNHQRIGDLHTYRCYSCRAAWVVLRAQGRPDDGIKLSEDIQAAHELLSTVILCPEVKAVAGRSAHDSIRRFLGTSTVGGLKLDISDRGGSNNIVVFGKPVLSQDGLASEPLMGSVWTLKEAKSKKKLIGWYGESPILWQKNEIEVIGNESDLRWGWTEIKPPNTVKTKGNPKLALDQAWEDSKKALHKVTGFGVTPQGHPFVIAATEDCVLRMMTTYFLKLFKLKEDRPIYAVGEEVIDRDDHVWTVGEVHKDHVILEYLDGSKPVTLYEMYDNYRKLHRKSAYQRILDGMPQLPGVGNSP